MRAAALRAAGFGLAWWALAGTAGAAFGAASVLIATAASLALLPPSGRRLRIIGVIRFGTFFARESLVGGIDVALRAAARRPADRTRGTYIAHRTGLEPGIPRSLLVGTVGLLPGTVAVEADGADLRVHVLDRSLAQPARVKALERRIDAMTTRGGSA